MVEAAAQMQALGGEGKTFVRIGGGASLDMDSVGLGLP